MSLKSLLSKLLMLALTVVKSCEFDGDDLIVSVRPRKSRLCRCPHCGRKAPVHDVPSDPRRWRALDLGQTKVYLEYRLPRVKCGECGVHAAGVPWARPVSRFTRDFEDQVAWLAVNCSKSAVSELMRIDWHTVGGICGRVYGDLEESAGDSRFDGLVRIGIDETSYKKGHRYMTVVVNHDTSAVVWCAKGYGKEVLRSFFLQLSDGQRASIRVFTADGAKWISEVLEELCPEAERVMDPFHVVSWMTDALDEVRKVAWREARKEEKAAEENAPKRGRGRPRKGEEKPESKADAIKGSRYSLLKNPEDLTESQAIKLERVARENKPLYRAYLLKERLRDVFKAKDADTAKGLLEGWLKSACHSANAKIRELSKKVRRHKGAIIRAVELGVSNARIEATNNKIKAIVRMAYGFRNIDNLIALVMLKCSRIPVRLPGRV